MVIDHPTGDLSAGVPEEPEELRSQTNQTEAGTFNMESTVVRDHFPSDAAGAPIPGIPQERSIYELRQAVLSDSDWAPFQSQRDWEVARWAKSSGVTSAAVSKLLSIPDVCPVFI
jgi:hypothetical protein